jgi:hypothetical protein
MTQRRIGIGETSSFRYIGVEPPIEDAQAEIILKAVKVPKWLIFGMHYHQDQERVDDSPSYTEFLLNVELYTDGRGNERVNRMTVDLAHQIAIVLEIQGDRVEVNDYIVPTDFKTPIFGSKTAQMHKTHEHFKSLRENAE